VWSRLSAAPLSPPAPRARKWEVEIRPNSDPSSPGSVSNGVYVMKKMEGKLMGI